VANHPAPHAHSSTQAVITPVESQRDSATKPRVASRELPWVNCATRPQPQRGCARRALCQAATPLGLTFPGPIFPG
jgi:hypothetical protein